MEVKYFPLGATENNRIIKIIRIVFGVICLVVASVYPVMINNSKVPPDGTFWITIIFLTGFGFYQVLAGAGLATRYIEIGPDFLRLKKNPLLPIVKMSSIDIEKIEFFPLNVVFLFKSRKHILLRFGTIYYETSEKIKDEILIFAEVNKIPIEIIEEKI
jgi:hypothetical protein